LIKLFGHGANGLDTRSAKIEHVQRKGKFIRDASDLSSKEENRLPKLCPICGTYYEGEGTTCKKCRDKRTRNLGQKIDEELPSSYSRTQTVIALLSAIGIMAFVMWFMAQLPALNNTPI
jgi:hypothetical protein